MSTCTSSISKTVRCFNQSFRRAGCQSGSQGCRQHARHGVHDRAPSCRLSRAARASVSVVAGLVLISIAAPAAPPSGSDLNSPTATWFRDLMRPDTNTSCCDASDCRTVVSRITPDGWEARIGARWLRVPPDRVLHQTNPTGQAVACYLPWLGIICFVPPPQS